jgi:hypothetical protein
MPTFSSHSKRQSLSTSYPRRCTIMSLVFLLAASSSALQAQAPATLSIAGPNEVRLGGYASYSALVRGVPSTAVVWSVKGVIQFSLAVQSPQGQTTRPTNPVAINSLGGSNS